MYSRKRAALALLSAGLVAAAQAGAQESPAPVNVELNKLEARSSGCRAYLVLRNRSASRFTALKLDLVMFDPDGIVAKRLAVEAAPLPSEKTSLKVFDIADVGCERIGRVLLNDVLTCEHEPAGSGECLAIVSVSSRSGTEFMR